MVLGTLSSAKITLGFRDKADTTVSSVPTGTFST
jgi:hypothetical protein